MTTDISKNITLKDGSKALIRKATDEDAQNLLEFLEEIVTGDRYLLTTPEDLKEMQMTVEKEEEWITKHSKDGNIVLVAQIGDNIAGSMSFDNGSHKRDRHTGKLHIALSKQYRGIGLGKALMEIALEWAKQDPLIEKVCLTVFADNDRAISLYKKMGFAEEGRKIREIKRGQDDYVDSILMYKFVTKENAL